MQKRPVFTAFRAFGSWSFTGLRSRRLQVRALPGILDLRRFEAVWHKEWHRKPPSAAADGGSRKRALPIAFSRFTLEVLDDAQVPEALVSEGSRLVGDPQWPAISAGPDQVRGPPSGPPADGPSATARGTAHDGPDIPSLCESPDAFGLRQFPSSDNNARIQSAVDGSGEQSLEGHTSGSPSLTLGFGLIGPIQMPIRNPLL
jgi:hypothetical protein